MELEKPKAHSCANAKGEPRIPLSKWAGVSWEDHIVQILSMMMVVTSNRNQQSVSSINSRIFKPRGSPKCCLKYGGDIKGLEMVCDFLFLSQLEIEVTEYLICTNENT